MTIKHNADKIPDCLYGRTYSEFNIEISCDKTICLYLTDAEDGNQYVIEGLADLRSGDIATQRCASPSLWDSDFAPVGRKKVLREKLEHIKNHYYKDMRAIREQHNYVLDKYKDEYNHRLFILFLKSITILSDLDGYLKHDVDFVKNYYNVELKVEED